MAKWECLVCGWVYDEDNGKGVIHDFCPYGREFKVSREDIENLFSLIKELDKNE